MTKVAFSIAVEPPPSSMPPEVSEYLNRVLSQCASALLEAETQMNELIERVEILESAP